MPGVMKSALFWSITPCSPLKVNRRLPPAFTLVYCTAYSTVKMEGICCSETSVNFQRTTWHYIPEDSTPDNLYFGHFWPNVTQTWTKEMVSHCTLQFSENQAIHSFTQITILSVSYALLTPGKLYISFFIPSGTAFSCIPTVGQGVAMHYDIKFGGTPCPDTE
jgi:hypothetical protein